MGRVFPKSILAPFPDISMHIVKPPGIRRKTCYRQCFLPVFSFSASGQWILAVIVGLIGGKAFPKEKWGVRSGPAGKFPFGLCGKSVFVCPFCLIESSDEILHMDPGDTFHWTIFPIFLKFGWIRPHDLFPMRLGDLRCLHPEASGQGDLVQDLVFASVRFSRWTAHHESTWRKRHELHSNGVFKGLSLHGSLFYLMTICENAPPCRRFPLAGEARGMRVKRPFDASTSLSIDPELCRRVGFTQGRESFGLAQDREPVERPSERQMGVLRQPQPVCACVTSSRSLR